MSPEILQFDEFDLDIARYELRRGDRVLKLEKNPMELLILLAENQGRLVTREEIIQRLWGDDVFVDTRHGINTAVHKLRTALRDDAEKPRILETIVGKGYRLACSVVPKTFNPDTESRDNSESVPDSVLWAQRSDHRPPVASSDVDTIPPRLLPEARTPRLSKKHIWVVTAVAVVVLGFIVGLNLSRVKAWLKGSNYVSPQPVAPLKIRRSIAVIGFKNLSGRGEAAWLSPAMADMLTTELAAGGQLRTIAGESIARAKRDLLLSDTDSYAPDTLLRLRKNLGTDLIISGSYSDLGGGDGPLRVDIRIQDAATGETKVLISETGTKSDLFQLVFHAGSDLRQKLGIGEIATMDLAGVQSSYPSSPQAARWYAEGLAKLRLDDALGARTLLEKATLTDPSYSLAHSSLALALSALGYASKAADEGKAAFELSGNLSREDRLLVEARYREVTKQWALAADIYRTLLGFFPDNPDYGLSLVRTYGFAGKGQEAEVTLSKLRGASVIAADDPRLLLADAATAGFLGNLQHSMQAASEAAARAEAQGARFQVARARALEGAQRWRVGDGKRAIELLNEAKQVYSAIGHRSGEAQTLHDIGTTLLLQGDLPGGQRALEQAASIRREIGEKYGLSRSINNLGTIFLMRGDLESARRMFAESFSLSRDVDNKNTMAASLNNLSSVMSDEGNYEGAEKAIQQSLTIARAISDKQDVIGGLLELADIRYRMGDLAAAQAKSEEAINIADQAGLKPYSAYGFVTLGDVAAARGDLSDSHKRYEDALAVCKTTNDKLPASQAMLGEGVVSFHEGQLSTSDTLIRQAIDQFRTRKMIDNEIVSRSMLGLVLVAEGKLADARSQVDSATQLAANSQNRDSQLALAIASSKVLAAQGEGHAAVEVLVTKLHDVKHQARLDLRYEARLALAEIEMSSGRTAAGRTHLIALQGEAASKGFLLIAHKASEDEKMLR